MTKKYSPYQTKMNILDASLVCFKQYGFQKTNISLISKESKVSVGSIYHHYTNKESLYYELYQMYLEEMLKSIHDQVNTIEKPKEYILTFCTAYLKWVEKNKLKSMFIYWGAITEIDFTKNLTSSFDKAQYLNAIALKIMSFAAGKHIKNYPPHMYEILLISPLSEFSRRYLTDPKKSLMRDAIAVLPMFVWESVSLK